MSRRFVGLACTLLLAACGGTQLGSSASPTATEVEPTPTPLPTLATDVKEARKAPPGALDIRLGIGPAFTPDKAKVEAGDVVFFLHNPPPTSEFFTSAHNFSIGHEIGQPFASSPNVDPGESIVFTVHGLTPGTYTYWCTVDLHYTHGMVGTLTVR